MMGLTHAIGGATTVMALNYINPEFFPLNIWLIILSFLVAQGPDIDIHNSKISKNIYLKPVLFVLSPFIDGHRAKQTHSIFGTIIYGLISLPLILISKGFWLALVLAYFSHIFLDYFNPTGVKLFYFPIINSKPRSWSLYNTIPHLLVEIPYLLKKFFNIFSKKKQKIERKQIKFDGVGVMTGGFLEKFISIGLWISFLILIVINIKELKYIILSNSFILNTFFPITLLILLNITFYNLDLIKKYKKIFKLFFFLGFFIIVLSYTSDIFKFGKQIKDLSYFVLFLLLYSFTLFPLIFILIKKFYENIKSLPSSLFAGKEDKKLDISDYTILTHFLLLVLVMLSFSGKGIENYNKNYNHFITYYNKLEDKKDILKDGIKNIRNIYIKSLEESKKELKEKRKLLEENLKKTGK